MTTLTVAAALASASMHVARLEARLLLQEVAGLTAAAIVAHPEQLLTDEQLAQFQLLLARRKKGEPIAYLLGRREFYGHEFFVAPGVLIPRPETELLVELGLALLAGRPQARVLDLGCGSGCIAVSVALACPAAEVWAVDASSAALAIAQRNAATLGACLELRQSNWFGALAQERFHLILSNPPYIAAEDEHLSQGDLRFEPLTALASGSDGLDDIRQLIAQAPQHLHAAGRLYLEHGHDQAAAVAGLLQLAGFDSIEQHRDLAGIVRVTGGCWRV